MLRTIIGFALVAVVFGASSEQEWKAGQGQAELQQRAAALKARASISRVETMINGASLDASSKSLGRIDDELEEVEGVADQIDGSKAAVDKAVKDNEVLIDTAIDAAKNELADKINAALARVKASLKSSSDALEATYKEQIGEVEGEVSDLNDKYGAMSDFIDESKACTKKGQVYSDKKSSCIKAGIADDAGFSRIYHKGFADTDGRDHGFVNNRQVAFEKKAKDSHIKVMYIDNMRVHGHTAHANWNAMVCDEGGNGCAHCADPGKMQHWRWSGHQHNWWVNDHHHGTLFALCKKADNRVLGVGKYMIKIKIESNRYDIHTGHGGQYGQIHVEEVMKG